MDGTSVCSSLFSGTKALTIAGRLLDHKRSKISVPVTGGTTSELSLYSIICFTCCNKKGHDTNPSRNLATVFLLFTSTCALELLPRSLRGVRHATTRSPFPGCVLNPSLTLAPPYNSSSERDPEGLEYFPIPSSPHHPPRLARWCISADPVY